MDYVNQSISLKRKIDDYQNNINITEDKNSMTNFNNYENIDKNNLSNTNKNIEKDNDEDLFILNGGVYRKKYNTYKKIKQNKSKKDSKKNKSKKDSKKNIKL